MNSPKTAVLRAVSFVRAVAKAHSHKAALLLLAAAGPLLALAIRGADSAIDLRAARLLVIQQRQIEQNPLPTDLVPVQVDQAPKSVGNLFSLSHWPFWPSLPPGMAPAYPGCDFYL
jgi:hypothetical protein